MATTYTWIGTPGVALDGSIPLDWTPSGPPQDGDTAILANGGTIDIGNGQLVSNTVSLVSGKLVFARDSRIAIGTPSLDEQSLLTTFTGTSTVEATTIDALGNAVNAGTILANCVLSGSANAMSD